MDEVNILAQNKLWNTAINRIYYACYYAVNALFVKHGLSPHTHSGVRQMFGLHFIKTGLIDKEKGRFFSDIYDKRQTGDYDDFISYTEEDILSLIPIAKTFIAKIEELLKTDDI
ncbi:MAG: hypothetical protein B6D64_09010 [Bacteroidetes bacterium 4484_276]|nr:MAG: hypothetical protein B6D64_09010 [Bacteroidetes bacterium 4484_276]